MGSQRMPETAWLGLDLGTQSVRAMLVSERGEIIGIGSEKLNSERSGGKHEQIPDGWPHQVFADLGVPPEILPPVVRAGTVLGLVSAAASAETSLPQGTPVIAGMTDGCAAQIGAGALGVGSWNSVLGTTLVLKGVSVNLIRDPAGVVYCHRSPDGNWLPGGASSTGAGAISKHFAGRDLEALATKAAEREPASATIYPLAGRGERFPFVVPEAEWVSLCQPTDEIDHYAALLQGVALVERLCFDYLAMMGAPVTGPIVLTGGGAKSKYWCQLRADILGRPLSLPANAEAALGMAILLHLRAGSAADPE